MNEDGAKSAQIPIEILKELQEIAKEMLDGMSFTIHALERLEDIVRGK